MTRSTPGAFGNTPEYTARLRPTLPLLQLSRARRATSLPRMAQITSYIAVSRLNAIGTDLS
jgi:hypothetical protein